MDDLVTGVFGGVFAGVIVVILFFIVGKSRKRREVALLFALLLFVAGWQYFAGGNLPPGWID